MKIGVPTEIKPQESRVALTPAGADRLATGDHEILVQAGAGVASGFQDVDYERAGARVLADAPAVFGEADMILKVKEPLEPEWALLRPGQTLFTYLHLAAERGLCEGVRDTGVYGFAYETLEQGNQLPLLTPMSEVAGRMAIQAGAYWLERSHGGLGILLGGVPGTRPGKVLVLGGGVVGTNAARMACGLGADVVILDVDHDRMRYLDEMMPANCCAIYSTPMTLREYLQRADLVVGAVLIAGAAAPKLVREDDLKLMKKGSVIVDVAVDQGGCVETTRHTTHDDPVYLVDDVIHYCVANMPGAVPRTSTVALTHATLNWTLKLADLGPQRAVVESPELATAANVIGGHVTHPAVAEAFDLPFVPPQEAVSRTA